jgi:hypothetical protein
MTTSHRPPEHSTHASHRPSGDHDGSATTREYATICGLIGVVTEREARAADDGAAHNRLAARDSGGAR